MASTVSSLVLSICGVVEAPSSRSLGIREIPLEVADGSQESLTAWDIEFTVPGNAKYKDLHENHRIQRPQGLEWNAWDLPGTCCNGFRLRVIIILEEQHSAGEFYEWSPQTAR